MSLDVFDSCLENFKSFRGDIAPRLTKELQDKYDRLVDNFRKAIVAYGGSSPKSTVKECAEIICRLKNLNPTRLTNEMILQLRDLNFKHEEIAILFGTVRANIERRDRSAKKRAEEKAYGPIVLPGVLKEKKVEDLTDEEIYQIAKWKILQTLTHPGVDKESLDAAKAIMEHNLKRAKDESIKRWAWIREADGFLRTEFLPALYKEFELNNIQVDIKKIFKAVYKNLQGEIRKVVGEMYAESDLDEVVRKAKRRGKWLKKKSEKVSSGLPVTDTGDTEETP